MPSSRGRTRLTCCYRPSHGEQHGVTCIHMAVEALISGERGAFPIVDFLLRDGRLGQPFKPLWVGRHYGGSLHMHQFIGDAIIDPVKAERKVFAKLPGAGVAASSTGCQARRAISCISSHVSLSNLMRQRARSSSRSRVAEILVSRRNFSEWNRGGESHNCHDIIDGLASFLNVMGAALDLYVGNLPPNCKRPAALEPDSQSFGIKSGEQKKYVVAQQDVRLQSYEG
jgi:hypothetical protein